MTDGVESRRRLRTAMARVGEPCDLESPPRSVPKDHPQGDVIRAVASDVRRIVRQARLEGRRGLARRGLRGGADIYESDRLSARVALSARDTLQGLKLIALGSERAVYDLPGAQVLKVAMDDGGKDQCARETRIWRNADAATALLLCPVLAAGAGWVVMTYASPVLGGDRSQFKRITWDASEGNVGLYCGRVVLVDYGA